MSFSTIPNFSCKICSFPPILPTSYVAPAWSFEVLASLPTSYVAPAWYLAPALDSPYKLPRTKDPLCSKLLDSPYKLSRNQWLGWACCQCGFSFFYLLLPCPLSFCFRLHTGLRPGLLALTLGKVYSNSIQFEL